MSRGALRNLLSVSKIYLRLGKNILRQKQRISKRLHLGRRRAGDARLKAGLVLLHDGGLLRVEQEARHLGLLQDHALPGLAVLVGAQRLVHALVALLHAAEAARRGQAGVMDDLRT